MEKLLFYDIETYKYDSLVVFMDIEGNEVEHLWSINGTTDNNEDLPNGFEGLQDIISGSILAGYNNYYYDDTMLSYMKIGRPQQYLKHINDQLINGEKVSKAGTVLPKTIDCMQQIDVSRPSLKQIEGNMGRSIVECDIPFDIDRPLTDEEKEVVLQYCRYDVLSTIEVYKQRVKSYFETKNEVLTMLGNEKAYKWNTTTISANLLMKKPSKHWTKLMIPDKFWRNVKDVPDKVWNMWEKVKYSDLRNGLSEKGVDVDIYDCEFKFGFGGLHGVAKDGSRFENVKLLDVGSMYPSIIILLNALGDSTEKYDNIRRERLKIKHTDPVRSGALKLILNSVYGLLKLKFSTLYNPFAALTVCVYGQLALFDLSREIYEAGYKLVNMNTDGVGFVDINDIGDDTYEEIWHEWEHRWGLNLELDEFDLWIQRDVNNYVAKVKGKDKLKLKGGDCNKYNTDKFFSNNNIRIVQIALVDKLLYDKDPLDTIVEHLSHPELFQYVLKAGGTFKCVSDADGNVYNKVNRVFAAKDTVEGTTKLYKVRHDGGYVNFPDAPERMFVWNNDVKDLENFSNIVDINHYYQLINKKLEAWTCM